MPASGRAPGDAAAAAISFATRILGVSDVIVCGHSHCGAMRALLEGVPHPAPELEAWLPHAGGALERFRRGERMRADLAPHDHLSQFNVLEQLDHLRTYPDVRDRVASRRLRLHGWWFDIASAEVLAYEEERGGFVVIDEAHAERILARLGPG